MHQGFAINCVGAPSAAAVEGLVGLLLTAQAVRDLGTEPELVLALDQHQGLLSRTKDRSRSDLLLLRKNELRRTPLDHRARVRIEGIDHGDSAGGAGMLTRAAEDFTVPGMAAVKIADRDHGAFQARRIDAIITPKYIH